MPIGVEVEVKAHIPSVETVSERIRERWDAEGLVGPTRFDKEDTYYCQKDDPGEKTQFRLRRSGGTAVVTGKRKSFIGSCEVNGETEFEVSDADAFHDLVTMLGFKPCIDKRKIGSAWKAGRMTIELSEVYPLGAFIEIEIVLDPDVADGAAIAQARDEILMTLTRLQIAEDAIERRYYNDLLRHHKKHSTPGS